MYLKLWLIYTGIIISYSLVAINSGVCTFFLNGDNVLEPHITHGALFNYLLPKKKYYSDFSRSHGVLNLTKQ